MRRGRRESQWAVVRRCLAIIRRAQRGPATREELWQAAVEEEGAEPAGEARWIRLAKDLARIRDELGVELRFERELGGYTIRETWLPLLDLPPEDLATIAWLEQTFGPDSPQHDPVHAFLGRLRLYLPPERLGELERQHTTLVLDLARRDQDPIASAVWEGLGRALASRRRVEFAYLSPQWEDATPRRQVVDPYERYFDPARGHYYLHGWCHYSVGPEGRQPVERYIDYRLGRIRDLCLLPERLPLQPPRPPCYAVEYELAPEVARLGVSRPRGITVREVLPYEDGRARVVGESDNLFSAVQALLHYGAACRVLGGPELLARMRATVRKMAENYGEGE